jgi:hypothetical protein
MSLEGFNEFFQGAGGMADSVEGRHDETGTAPALRFAIGRGTR